MVLRSEGRRRNELRPCLGSVGVPSRAASAAAPGSDARLVPRRARSSFPMPPHLRGRAQEGRGSADHLFRRGGGRNGVGGRNTGCPQLSGASGLRTPQRPDEP